MRCAGPTLFVSFSLIATLPIGSLDGSPAGDAPEPNASKIVTEWTFPHGPDGGIQTIGIANGPIQTSILDTKKPFGEVWTFYAKKIGSDKEYGERKGYFDHGKTKDGRYCIRDLIRTGESRRTFFVYTCPRFTVTAIVRPDRDRTVVDMTVVTHK